jgi:hypothetical protein
MKVKKRFAKVLGITLALMLAMVLTAPAAQATLADDIELAIEKGLDWLANAQNPDGSWGGWNEVARTGLAVLKFETHATFMGLNPLDPDYEYNTVVRNGLNYIFNNSHDIDIWDEGLGTPDIHPPGGNGIGVRCYVIGKDDFHVVYETGCALMAICASNSPGEVVGGAGPQAGRTYEEVAGDIVDYLAFAQNNPATGANRGGWRYYANYGDSDNSITGYATLGLSYAEASPPWGFNLAIPPFVLPELNLYIDWIQNDPGPGDDDGELDPDGGSGYVVPWDWVNILKTGNLLNEMSLFGDTQATPRVQEAVNYIERHWNDLNDDPGWKGGPHYQACFTTMKGFQALGIDEINVGGPLDWYADMAAAIVAAQNPDGSWPANMWGDEQLSTCWAMLTLEKAAPPALQLIPPADTNPPLTWHEVVAIYEVGGVPKQGILIHFEITSGPNAGITADDHTDAMGMAGFQYLGSNQEGTDIIKASAYDQAGVLLVTATATKTWQVPPSIPGITPWGILAAAIVLSALIPLVLRRRRLAS